MQSQEMFVFDKDGTRQKGQYNQNKPQNPKTPNIWKFTSNFNLIIYYMKYNDYYGQKCAILLQISRNL